MKKLSKSELIDLVRKIRNVEYNSEKKHSEAIFLFKDNVPHPSAANLIYHHKPRLTNEEVVEKALAYKPIILPPPDDIGQKEQE